MRLFVGILAIVASSLALAQAPQEVAYTYPGAQILGVHQFKSPDNEIILVKTTPSGRLVSTTASGRPGPVGGVWVASATINTVDGTYTVDSYTVSTTGGSLVTTNLSRNDRTGIVTLAVESDRAGSLLSSVAYTPVQ